VTPSADSAAFGRVNEHLGVSRTHPDEPLLVLDDLKTHFRTDRGLVRAVDGVSLSLRRGESLGVVGESGSGKTVLSRSIMGLLPSTAVTSGSVKFAGQEILGLPDKQMRHLWGAEMSMVFQNPLNSLNPLDAGLAWETINLGCGRPVENRYFVSVLEEILGRQAQIVDTPAPVSEPAILFADIGKARRLLGWEPRVTVEEGLARFVEWFRAVGLA